MSFLAMLWYYFNLSLKQLNNYQGRSSRREFIIFHVTLMLFCLLAYFIIACLFVTTAVSGIDTFFSVNQDAWTGSDPNYTLPISVGVFTIIICIFVAVVLLISLFASLALTVRRLHDLGHSGWWVAGYFSLAITVFIMTFTLADNIVFSWLIRVLTCIPSSIFIYLCINEGQKSPEKITTGVIRSNSEAKNKKNCRSMYTWKSMKNMINSDARSTRMTFWLTQVEFFGYTIISYKLIIFILNIFFPPIYNDLLYDTVSAIYLFIMFIYAISQPALFARRAHDVGITAIYIFVMLGTLYFGGLLLSLSFAMSGTSQFIVGIGGVIAAIGVVIFLIISLGNSKKENNQFINLPIV